MNNANHVWRTPLKRPRKYKQNQAWRLCTHCGKEPRPGRRYCQKCADRNKASKLRAKELA